MDPSVVTAIIGAVVAIVLAIMGWASGLFAWIGRLIDDWRAERRRLMPKPPKRTLHVAVDYSITAPIWGGHDFGEGRFATICQASLFLNNLTDQGVLPSRAEVLIKQLPWGRLRVHSVCFGDNTGQMTSIPRRSPRRGWMLKFYVLPELKSGDTLRTDVVIYDSFGNRHVVKNVHFTMGAPDALPF